MVAAVARAVPLPTVMVWPRRRRPAASHPGEPGECCRRCLWMSRKLKTPVCTVRQEGLGSESRLNMAFGRFAATKILHDPGVACTNGGRLGVEGSFGFDEPACGESDGFR